MTFSQIVHLKKKFSIGLTLFLLFVVGGFLYVSTQFKDINTYMLTEGLSVGLTAAMGVILLAIVLAFYYAWWMNKIYDPALKDINLLDKTS